MGVTIPIPVQELEQESSQPSRTYRYSTDRQGRGRILARGSADGLEAVEQYISKTLRTPRFRCLVYDNQYGSELKNTIIAGDVTPEYIESELPWLVEDALLVDDRIFEVYGFSFSFEHEEAHIRFTAVTVFGETVIEEVI